MLLSQMMTNLAKQSLALEQQRVPILALHLRHSAQPLQRRGQHLLRAQLFGNHSRLLEGDVRGLQLLQKQQPFAARVLGAAHQPGELRRAGQLACQPGRWAKSASGWARLSRDSGSLSKSPKVFALPFGVVPFGSAQGTGSVQPQWLSGRL